MSSSARRFADYLRDSLAAIEREVPHCHAQLVAEMGERTAWIGVGSTRVGLRPEGDRLLVRDELDGLPSVVLDTDDATIGALLAGRRSLLEVVRGRRLVLRGAVPDLVAFHRALRAYLQGCVRSPTIPSLLQAYTSRLAGSDPGLADSAMRLREPPQSGT